MFKKLNRKGFTIIEFIVVIALIGILVLLAAPRYLNYTNDAKVATMQADIKVLSNSSTLFSMDNSDKFPILDGESVTINDNNLKEYLIGCGIEKTDNDITASLAKIDKEKISKYVKTLANSYDDYFIVTDGVLTGEVFHLNGITDGSGIKQFGLEKRN